ncbi:MAG: hypothetical protein H0T51_11280 [Pirellulales bacterium]|nr:hypothetical protein [Pirellulales bacterium]
MQTTILNTTRVRIFESAGELIAVAEADRVARASHRVDACDSSWLGRSFGDWRELLAACDRPWSEGQETLARLVDRLRDAAMPKPKSRRRRTRFDEANGDELDYDRMRSGQDFWRTSRREVTSGPASVTVLVDVGARNDKTPEQIFWRGAAAIVLTELLEAAGYRVELWAVNYTEGIYGRAAADDLFQAVCLKRTSDPLDTATLVNTVSGWFYRTVIFQARHAAGPTSGPNQVGGSSCPPASLLDEVTRDEQRQLVADVWDSQAAERLVRRTVESLKQ